MNEPRRNEVFEAPRARDQVPDGQLNIFSTPDVDVPLPSQGKVYPEGSPLHDAKVITIGSMTTAQENILTNRSLAKRGSLITHLIQSSLRDKSISARDMLSGDRNTIMVSIRASGYGAEYKASTECSRCQLPTEQTFELNKFEIKTLGIEPLVPGKNLFEFRLPQSGATVRFKFLTGADEEDMMEKQAQRRKIGPDVADAELITTGLLASIVSINGISDRAQLNSAMPKMPAGDSRALRSYIQDNEPRIEMKKTVSCRHCDHTEEVEMPVGAAFFWPNAK